MARLAKRVEQVRASWESIRGDKRQLEAERAEFSTQITQTRNLAKLAVQEQKPMLVTRYANQVQSDTDVLKQLDVMLERDNAMENYLHKLTDYLENKQAEEQHNLDVALKFYNIATRNAAATRAARKAMGGPDKEALDFSMKEIADRTFALVGEVEVFMDTTKPLLESMDFENKANSMAALQNFQEWLQSDSDVMPKAEKQQLLLEAGATQFLPAATVAASPVMDEYNLIKK